MHIPPELGIFWRSRTDLQIGLDPRAAVVVEGLSVTEQELVSFLSTPRTEPEIDGLASRKGIEAGRVSEILMMLSRAGVLLSYGTDHCDKALKLSGSSPQRDHHSVLIERLDVMGVSIGLALARAGVGAIVFHDRTPISSSDHPALYPRWEGSSRYHGFLFAVRQVAPGIRVTGEPDMAVLSGSRIINPNEAMPHMFAGLPHLLVWTEDVDVCVDPLVQPRRSACAGCVYQHLLESDPAWRLLLPQALSASSLIPEQSSLAAATALSVRAILTQLDHGANRMENRQYRIAPLPGSMVEVQIPPHQGCGCTAELPELP